MTAIAIEWAWNQDLPPVEKLVLLALAQGGEGIGGPWPTEADVAQMTRVDIAEVCEIEHSLRDRGILADMQERVYGKSEVLL